MHITGLKQQLQTLISGRAAFEMELFQRQGTWKWLLARGFALCRMLFRPYFRISPFHFFIYLALLLSLAFSLKITVNIVKHYRCRD